MKKITKNEGKTVMTYAINEELGFVTCVIKGCSDDLFAVLDKYSATAGIPPFVIHALMREKYQDVFVGGAACNESDEFDEVYGMRLAKSRAQHERMNYRNNEIRKVIARLDHLANVLEEHAIRPLPKEYRPEATEAE